MTLHVELVSPEQVLYSGDASMVVARTSGGGDIAFLTGHAPFLGVLEPGVVRVIEEEGAELRVAVFGGFVEVEPRSSLDPERRGRALDDDRRRRGAAHARRSREHPALWARRRRRSGTADGRRPARRRGSAAGRRPPLSRRDGSSAEPLLVFLVLLTRRANHQRTGLKGSEREVPAAPPALDPFFPPP